MHWELSKRFDEALALAADLHRGHIRKGTDKDRDGEPARPVPYVAHLLAVASLVLEAGGDEDEAIAALLHDAIEDRPDDGRTAPRIRAQFGERVLEIVKACTKEEVDKSKPYEEQQAQRHAIRERYMQHVREMAPSARLVSAADKLHNARAIVADLRDHGPSALERFNVPPEKTLWYYDQVLAALRDSGAPARLVHDLNVAVAEMHALAGSPPQR